MLENRVRKKASLAPPIHEFASKIAELKQLRIIVFFDWYMLYNNLILLTCNCCLILFCTKSAPKNMNVCRKEVLILCAIRYTN